MIWLSIWISNTYYLHKQFYLFKVLLPFQEIPILFCSFIFIYVNFDMPDLHQFT